MKPVHRSALLLFAIVALAAVMAWQSPLAQWPNYHAFADQRSWLDLPRAADVLSNLPFALVGLCGLILLWRQDEDTLQQAGLLPCWFGFSLFHIALVLTAAGSAWYHLQPDNGRLVWDRLPIALACAGLADAAASRVLTPRLILSLRTLLLLLAPASVLWWSSTLDLAPYAFLQTLPFVLIPLGLLLSPAMRQDSGPWLLGVAGYGVAKVLERADHVVFERLHWISGHTLKHIVAAVAGLTIVWIVQRHLRRAALAPSSTGPAAREGSHDD